jgi:hypothetical protein
MTRKGEGSAARRRYDRPVRRRLALALAAVLALPALAGAADTQPKRKLNAADEKRAASIVIKRADLAAGWKRTTSPGDDTPLTCSFYAPNGSDLTITGDAESEFEGAGGIPSLLSYADVYTSAADASKSWTRTVKPALARCFADYFRREAVKEQGISVSRISYGKLAFPKVAPRTAAYRISLTVTATQSGQTASVAMAIHLVVVGRGRAEAGMVTLAPRPGIPAAELRSFAKLLADRMKAAGF